MDDMKDIRHASDLACVEAESAVEKFGEYNSLHEAFAVLLEEVDELWLIVKQKQYRYPDPFGSRQWPEIREEAIQIAAVALRIAADAERLASR